MKRLNLIPLFALFVFFLGLKGAKAEDAEVSDYSDLVLEDNEINLIEKPLFSVGLLYESNHLFYEFSGITGGVSIPLTKKLSFLGHLGVSTFLGNKKLLEYYLNQNALFNAEHYYPKPSSFIMLGFEYQILASRVNFFNRAALPLSFGIQIAGISEFYAHSVQRYFTSIAGVFRVKIPNLLGIYFSIQASTGIDPSENRTTYFIGPYWLF